MISQFLARDLCVVGSSGGLVQNATIFPVNAVKFGLVVRYGFL